MPINEDEPTGPEGAEIIDLNAEIARQRANEGVPAPLDDAEIERLYQRCVEVLAAHHVETSGDFAIRPIPCADLASYMLDAMGIERVKLVALAFHSVGEHVGRIDNFERRIRDYLRNDMGRGDDASKFKLTPVRQAAAAARTRLNNARTAPTAPAPPLRAVTTPENGDIAPGHWLNGEAMVKAFNRRHALTLLGGTPVVAMRELVRSSKSTVPLFLFIKVRAFHDAYANVRCTNPNPRGTGDLCGADVWLTHRDRRQYLGGVVFEPRQHSDPRVLNLWRGFGYALEGFGNYALPADRSVMPRPRGSWRRLRKHILDNLCSGRRDVYDYIIKWCARVVQRPWEKGQTFISITGPQGAGKGIFGSTLIKLLGDHGRHFTNPRFFEGQFNAALNGCVFALFDESTFAGSKVQANKLKGMATEDDLWIEPKNVDPYPVKNTLHMMFLTNEEHAAMLSPDSRRTVMLKASGAQVGNLGYFKRLMAELGQRDDSGYKAMLWDLLTMDLSTFEVMDIPRTSALAEQRHLSLDGPAAWLGVVLERGYVYDSKIGLSERFRRWNLDLSVTEEDEGPMLVSNELLHASYLDYCRVMRDRTQLLNRQQLVVWLQDTFRWPMTQLRGQLLGEEMRSNGAALKTGKGRVIRFPELAVARMQFRTKMGLDALPEPAVAFEESDREPPPRPAVQDDIPF